VFQEPPEGGSFSIPRPGYVPGNAIIIFVFIVVCLVLFVCLKWPYFNGRPVPFLNFITLLQRLRRIGYQPGCQTIHRNSDLL
jgi:hypothetical protein